MDNILKNNTAIVVVVIIGIIVGYLLGSYIGYKKGYVKGQDEARSAMPAMMTEEVKPSAANPFVAPTQTTTNPFSKVKINPFAP